MTGDQWLWRATVWLYGLTLVAQVLLFFTPLPPIAAQGVATVALFVVVVFTFGAAIVRHPESRMGKIGLTPILRDAAPWTVALAGVHMLWIAIRATAFEKRSFALDEPWTRNVWLGLAATQLAFLAVSFAIMSATARGRGRGR